jgi:hypothetical protein
MTQKLAVWLCAVVGVVWMVIGLRDVFAPHLFRFDGRVAEGSTILLDFASGVVFLGCAFALRQANLKTA